MNHELTPFQKQYLDSLEKEKQEELNKHSDQIEAFRARCANLDIDPKQIVFDYEMTTGITASFPNLLLHLNPELERDKDGLIDMQTLKKFYQKQPMSHGYLFGDDYVVMASKFFRRSMSQGNSYAPRFIEMFWGMEDERLSTSILIDFNRVRIDSMGSMIELDTWYGASFNQDIGAIKDGLVKLAPPSTLDDFDIKFFFSSVIALDIEWGQKREHNRVFKNFQAEEFKTEDTLLEYSDDILHPSRYIHSEYDLDKKCFTHFDGAIHFYSTEDYILRRFSDFNYNAKNDKHIKGSALKLFRIDGSLTLDKWTEFVGQFFTGNPLVHEYFEGKLPERIQNMIDAKMKDIE